MSKKLYKHKVILDDGEERMVNTEIRFDSGVKIICLNEIMCSVEMFDRIIVLLNWYHATGLYDINRNIFCYSTKTGELLWQVENEPPYLNGTPRNSAFVGMSVNINKGKKNSEWYTCDSDDKETIIKNFDLEKDNLEAGTFHGDRYKLNPINGKLTWLSYSK